MAKDPKTIQEQLDLLQERGMAFRDLRNAPHFLANISYYRLKGYWWETQSNKVDHEFAKGSFFEDVVGLYNFDRHFRLIVFNAIERIEVALRTKLIYHMSLAYGPEWYLDGSLFQNSYHHTNFVTKIQKDIHDSSEEFIKKHFENHPGEQPESWKALEVVTLGTLSKLYKNIKHQLPEKAQIAKEFGLYNQKYLASWLLSITLVRNIVAHHSRLWNRVIINQYDWPDKTPFPLLSYIPDANRRRKIFPLLAAMLYLNDRISPGHHLKTELIDLFEAYPNTPSYKMGFPPKWLEEPIFK
jgi:abortive infection bacteriophage resistance protein